MGSVIATWKGSCPDRAVRDELLVFLEELARRNEARDGRPRHRGRNSWRRLTADRQGSVPPLADTRRFDGEVAGPSLISLDVHGDQEALAAEALSLGIEGVRRQPGDTRASFLKLDRVALTGLDFGIFDPRGLYPEADRMSFVFLESETPCLDGRLVAVTEHDRCVLSGVEAITKAEMFLECPFIHLRYYLEEWSDILFSWLKYFFIPDLHYWRYSDMHHFHTYRELFDEFRGRFGAAEASRLTFDALLERFEANADEWIEKLQTF